MNKHNEFWINEVLDSTKGMRRAEAPVYLSAQIQNKIKQQNRNAFHLNTTQIKWLVAASLILVSFNGIAIYKYQQSKQAASITSHVNEYSFDSNELVKL